MTEPSVETRQSPPAPAESEHRHHHHSRAPESAGRQFARKYGFMIGWSLVVLLGIYLLIERRGLRGMLLRGWGAANAFLGRAVYGTGQGIQQMAARATLADIAGAILLLAALATLLWRLRWRLMRDEALTTLQCPRCGGHLHRVHRRRLDHLLSYYIPVYRYRCADKTCHWDGLRVDTRYAASQAAAQSRWVRVRALALTIVLFGVFLTLVAVGLLMR